jgi:RES domain-containing protein
MPRSWRIVHRVHISDAFDGLGARRFPGRWNQPGVPLVYTSESLALATLEMLVHLEDWQMLEQYACIPVEFDQCHVQELTSADLPGNWRESPVPPSTRKLGSEWVTKQSSPVLKVPSVVIPEEINYLLNPAHPAFAELLIGEPRPYNFDPRL